MFIVFSLLFAIVGLISFIGFISHLIDNKISEAITLFWKFIGFGVWSTCVFVFFSYLFPEISANDDGIQTTFFLKKLTVNWEDIVEIYSSKPFGLRVGERASIIVTRNKLTFFHRIYGIIYGQTHQPSLLIWSSINDYASLINKIKKNRKKR